MDQQSVIFESTMQAEYVGKRLDFLTKELVRLREERRIAAMVKLAERTRRMREAEESGVRQLELIWRDKTDFVFKQMMQVHQESIDSYLLGIVNTTVNETAKEEAIQHVQHYQSILETEPTQL